MIAIAGRLVSKLSPGQLARKRAYDRDAQRASRAKNRLHVEKLEHELEKLRGTRAEELQYMQERNRALETEVFLLRQAYQGCPYLVLFSRPTDVSPFTVLTFCSDAISGLYLGQPRTTPTLA
jgi:hypothetical protein